jgi:hypothetical protein
MQTDMQSMQAAQLIVNKLILEWLRCLACFDQAEAEASL